MRISILIAIYTIHFAYLKVFTKFHNPKLSSCYENSDYQALYQISEFELQKLLRNL